MSYNAEVQIENDDGTRQWKVIANPFTSEADAMQAAQAAYLETPEAIAAGVSENGILIKRYGSPGRGAPEKWKSC